MNHRSFTQDNKAHNPSASIWNRAWPWFAITGMAVLACVLGYVGFRKYALAMGTGDTPFDLAYRTLQLFVLESGYVKGSIPWELEAARALAPLVPAWAVLQALRVLFREQRDAFWLRRRKGHVVVCGLGRKGLQLVSDFRRAGEDVVVIECNKDNLNVATGQHLGARTLIGSCKDILLLRRAGVQRARYVVVVTGDDGTNVETAIIVHQAVRERDSSIKRLVRCYVHVVSLKLCHLLERHDLLSAPDVRMSTRIFNSYQNSARSLLEAHPLEPDAFDPDDPRSVHLVVFGFGQMGEAVVLQAAKLGHYANGKPLQITVIDEHADRLKTNFENRYPQMRNISDLQMEFVLASEESQEVLSQLRLWAAEPGTITSVAVCLDGDSASLTCALNVIAALHPTTIPVHVRMSQDTGLATLLDDWPGSGGWADSIHTFGMASLNSTRGMLLNRERDILARAFHHNYVDERKREGKSEDSPSMQDWDSLNVDLQDSTRQMADHLAVKLRVIGCYSGAGENTPRLARFEEEEVAVLARMEHARWCAERFIAGWRHGATNRDERTDVNLIDWEALDEDVQDYDRQAVLCIPRVLELIEE